MLRSPTPGPSVRRALGLAVTAILWVSLAGCGLADLGASAAAGGVSKAEEAKRAKETEARIQQQLDAAQAQAAEQRRAAEAASQ